MISGLKVYTSLKDVMFKERLKIITKIINEVNFGRRLWVCPIVFATVVPLMDLAHTNPY